MTSIEQLGREAGSAVREQARGLAGDPPAIEGVAGRHDRRRLAGAATGVLATIALVAATGLLGQPSLDGVDIVDPVAPSTSERAPTASPSAPADARSPSETPADAVSAEGPMMLPGGWSEPELPDALSTDEPREVVVAKGGIGVFALGRNLVVSEGDAWSVHEDVLPRVPEVLAVGDPGGEKWILAATGSTITVFDRELRPRTIEDVPEPLWAGALGAAWNGEAFVLVGPAEDRNDGNHAYLLDPGSGDFAEVGRAPLSANRPWNSSVVATVDAVLLVGTWLDPNSNAPGRPTLGAAALAHGSDEWQMVPGGSLSPQSADAVAVGDHAVVLDYEGRAAQLGPTGWGEPVETGLAPSECGAELALGNGTVLAAGCHQVASYDLAGRWTRIAGPTAAGGVSLARPVGGAGTGFLVPQLKWVGDQIVVDRFLHVQPDAAWPLVAGHDGQRLATPPGWQVASENLTPNLVRLTVTASTADMPVGGEKCGQVPAAALGALGPEDALVSIQSTPAVSAPSDAPAVGGLQELRDEWTETPLVHCVDDPDELSLYWIPARWGPEQFYVLIAHHRDAPATVIEQALAVANSFTWK